MKHLSLICSILWMLLGNSALWAQNPRKATILDQRDRIRITPVNVLNSSSRETNLSITPDGKFIYFMSLRGGQRWSQSYMTFRGDSVFDGDIWYAQKVNGRWQRPRAMPYGINTSQGEDEPNISGDGRTVYYQSWNWMWDRTGGPYYKASRSGADWKRPEGLGGGITEFFRTYRATDGMSISADEKVFIVAAGHDYDAPMDIYMSKKTRYGWTYCKRLPISSPRDDRSVFLAADGKTLYFASDGYEGHGGLDIFKTTLNSDGTFGEVVNLGPPFNTPQDDYGLILTGDGNEAYFIRNGNIQFADLRNADERMKPVVKVITHTLKGTVRDSASWRGLSAEILLLDVRTKHIIKRVKTSSNGSYSISLPNRDRNFDQIVTVEGYSQVRRPITTKVESYSKTIASNFILPKPGSQRPAPEPDPPPVLAERDPPPPPAQPDPPAQADPEPDPPPVVVRQEPEPTPPPVQQPPEEKPDPQPEPEPEPEEDPYSFTGVAENNLVLLLDVSASMKRPEKLPLLKDAFKRLLTRMRPEDQISVIIYSGNVQVVLEAVSAAQQMTIINAIDNLRSGGATKGKTALRRAYKLMSDHFIPGGNNRIIMATDGYFDVSDLYGIAERNAARNMILSVFSFGKLREEKLDELAGLAEKGNGNFSNITPQNVDGALLKEAKAVRRK